MSQCLCQGVCVLPDCDWSVATPVGVVDYCIERLIDPLPEHHGRSRPARLQRKGLISTDMQRFHGRKDYFHQLYCEK